MEGFDAASSAFHLPPIPTRRPQPPQRNTNNPSTQPHRTHHHHPQHRSLLLLPIPATPIIREALTLASSESQRTAQVKGQAAGIPSLRLRSLSLSLSLGHTRSAGESGPVREVSTHQLETNQLFTSISTHPAGSCYFFISSHLISSQPLQENLTLVERAKEEGTRWLLSCSRFAGTAFLPAWMLREGVMAASRSTKLNSTSKRSSWVLLAIFLEWKPPRGQGDTEKLPFRSTRSHGGCENPVRHPVWRLMLEVGYLFRDFLQRFLMGFYRVG